MTRVVTKEIRREGNGSHATEGDLRFLLSVARSAFDVYGSGTGPPVYLKVDGEFRW